MLIDYLERGEGRERERNIDAREKHPSVASCTSPDWGRIHNIGICPDHELNPQPFRAQDNTPTN